MGKKDFASSRTIKKAMSNRVGLIIPNKNEGNW